MEESKEAKDELCLSVLSVDGKKYLQTVLHDMPPLVLTERPQLSLAAIDAVRRNWTVTPLVRLLF